MAPKLTFVVASPCYILAEEAFGRHDRDIICKSITIFLLYSTHEY